MAEALKLDNLNIGQLALLVNGIAESKGFETTVEQADQKLLLAVGELVEAQNELRNGKAVGDLYWVGEDGTEFPAPGGRFPAGKKPEGFGVECADAVIRILQMMAAYKLPVNAIFEAKIRYNETRPAKHGKAF